MAGAERRVAPTRGGARRDGSRPVRAVPVRPGPGWYSAPELADMFGLTVNGVRQKLTGYAGPEARQTVAGVEFYLAIAVIDGYAQAKVNKRLREVASGRLGPGSYAIAEGEEGEDALMFAGGESSPWMERFREERAKTVALQRLRLEEQLIPREEVHRGYTRMAHRFRRCADVLERDYGAEARLELERTLDELRDETERLAGELGAFEEARAAPAAKRKAKAKPKLSGQKARAKKRAARRKKESKA